jgi:hypothetical protein
MSNTVSPITGNQYFSVVKNLELDPSHLLKGVEAVVAALDVPDLNTALPVATLPATGTLALSDAELSSLVNPGFLLVDATTPTAAVTLSVGADTAVRALALIRLLKLSQAVPSRLLRFEQAGSTAAFGTFLTNSTGTTTGGSGTALYVKICAAGGTASGSVSLIGASAVGTAYVIASLTSPASSEPSSSPAILFNVVRTSQS